MKTSASALVPFLRSDAQARLLAALLLGPAEEASLTELAAAMGVTPSSAHREVDRLMDAGLLLERRVGRTRLLRFNPDYRHLEPLAQILAASYGPVDVIRKHLGLVAGIDQVLVFGSYAARYQGKPGPEPRDIDILVIGDPAGRDVRRAASTIEDAISRPVQITVLTRDDWQHSESGFLRDVRSKPTITVNLEGAR